MKRKSLLFLGILLLAILAVGSFVYFLPRNPEKIVAGENPYRLGSMRLQHVGFEKFQTIVEHSENMPKIHTVVYFEAAVDEEGLVQSFTLSLNTFDADKQYHGLARYTYADNVLHYTAPIEDASILVREFNENSTFEFLGGELKKLPLKEQVKRSGLGRYVVRYQPFTIIEQGTPIFDGRSGNGFPVLSKEDYNAGKGGISDGKTNVVFRLYDGQSIATGQQYLYICKPLNPETAVGNQESMMECDYYINNGTLKFTRDFGQSWIETDITKEQLNSTMKFYRNSLSLPPASIFLSSESSLPIAYFYGGNPVLKLSTDNGQSWRDIAFPTAAEFGRDITKRVVGFVSPEFGYAALGTDWSMGGGENKFCYFTHDGGKTWTAQPLPLQGTSRTLNDLAMADEQTGIVAFDAGAEVYVPIVYATTDAGNTWTEITLPFEQLPQEVQYLIDIDAFTVEDGTYTLTFGQSDLGNIKAVFTASDLNGPWEFLRYERKTIHTVG